MSSKVIISTPRNDRFWCSAVHCILCKCIKLCTLQWLLKQLLTFMWQRIAIRESTNNKISSSHLLLWDCFMPHVEKTIYFLLKYCCDITPLRTRKYVSSKVIISTPRNPRNDHFWCSWRKSVGKKTHTKCCCHCLVPVVISYLEEDRCHSYASTVQLPITQNHSVTATATEVCYCPASTDHIGGFGTWVKHIGWQAERNLHSHSKCCRICDYLQGSCPTHPTS